MTPDLPSGVALTWGRRPERRLGPKPSMTIEEITAAAIGVADDGGLAALSMASVADRLGCTKMALYRYVQSKEDLHALMLDAGLGPPPVLDGGWRAAATAWAEALLARFRDHPWALDLPLAGMPLTRHRTYWLEGLLRALRPCGLPLPERLSVALLLSGHVEATARLQRDRHAAAGSVPPDGAAAAPGLLPAEVLAADGLDEVRAVFSGGHLADPDGDRQEFAFGLTCILDGAQARVARA